MFLKKNRNASRPSEHPPVRGEKMLKRLGGIKGCKYKEQYFDEIKNKMFFKNEARNLTF